MSLLCNSMLLRCRHGVASSRAMVSGWRVLPGLERGGLCGRFVATNNLEGPRIEHCKEFVALVKNHATRASDSGNGTSGSASVTLSALTSVGISVFEMKESMDPAFLLSVLNLMLLHTASSPDVGGAIRHGEAMLPSFLFKLGCHIQATPELFTHRHFLLECLRIISDNAMLSSSTNPISHGVDSISANGATAALKRPDYESSAMLAMQCCKLLESQWTAHDGAISSAAIMDERVFALSQLARWLRLSVAASLEKGKQFLSSQSTSSIIEQLSLMDTFLPFVGEISRENRQRQHLAVAAGSNSKGNSKGASSVATLPPAPLSLSLPALSNTDAADIGAAEEEAVPSNDSSPSFFTSDGTDMGLWERGLEPEEVDAADGVPLTGKLTELKLLESFQGILTQLLVGAEQDSDVILQLLPLSFAHMLHCLSESKGSGTSAQSVEINEHRKYATLAGDSCRQFLRLLDLACKGRAGVGEVADVTETAGGSATKTFPANGAEPRLSGRAAAIPIAAMPATTSPRWIEDLSTPVLTFLLCLVSGSVGSYDQVAASAGASALHLMNATASAEEAIGILEGDTIASSLTSVSLPSLKDKLSVSLQPVRLRLQTFSILSTELLRDNAQRLESCAKEALRARAKEGARNHATSSSSSSSSSNSSRITSLPSSRYSLPDLEKKVGEFKRYSLDFDPERLPWSIRDTHKSSVSTGVAKLASVPILKSPSSSPDVQREGGGIPPCVEDTALPAWNMQGQIQAYTDVMWPHMNGEQSERRALNRSVDISSGRRGSTSGIPASMSLFHMLSPSHVTVDLLMALLTGAAPLSKYVSQSGGASSFDSVATLGSGLQQSPAPAAAAAAKKMAGERTADDGVALSSSTPPIASVAATFKPQKAAFSHAGVTTGDPSELAATAHRLAWGLLTKASRKTGRMAADVAHATGDALLALSFAGQTSCLQEVRLLKQLSSAGVLHRGLYFALARRLASIDSRDRQRLLSSEEGENNVTAEDAIAALHALTSSWTFDRDAIVVLVNIIRQQLRSGQRNEMASEEGPLAPAKKDARPHRLSKLFTSVFDDPKLDLIVSGMEPIWAHDAPPPLQPSETQVGRKRSNRRLIPSPLRLREKQSLHQIAHTVKTFSPFPRLATHISALSAEVEVVDVVVADEKGENSSSSSSSALSSQLPYYSNSGSISTHNIADRQEIEKAFFSLALWALHLAASHSYRCCNPEQADEWASLLGLQGLLEVGAGRQGDVGNAPRSSGTASLDQNFSTAEVASIGSGSIAWREHMSLMELLRSTPPMSSSHLSPLFAQSPPLHLSLQLQEGGGGSDDVDATYYNQVAALFRLHAPPPIRSLLTDQHGGQEQSLRPPLHSRDLVVENYVCPQTGILLPLALPFHKLAIQQQWLQETRMASTPIRAARGISALPTTDAIWKSAMLLGAGWRVLWLPIMEVEPILLQARLLHLQRREGAGKALLQHQHQKQLLQHLISWLAGHWPQDLKQVPAAS